MAFIQDPRMRQRWNQISHTTEAVTENAAAGIWTFGHRYINPCLASLGYAVDSCTAVCLGDREDRARRARERDRGARRTRAEYTFDFYDDWDDYYEDPDYYAGDDSAGGSSSGGGGGGWNWGVGRSEDWDRLLAGTGAVNRGGLLDSEPHHVVDQPRRKRGMSYGTTRPRRKASAEEDPNIIPRTAPLGFLGRLPFNIVGSLRYKPSAANLKEHPGGGKDGLLGGGTGGGGGGSGGETAEHEPLLGGSNGDDMRRYTSSPQQQSSARPRSNTTESGDTSSSYRSRGDLFPSDGEGDEDAVPLDEDEFTVALNRVDDRSSNRTRSSKGKRPDKDKGLSRTVSRTTMNSVYTLDSANNNNNSNNNLASSPFPTYDDDAPEVPVPSLEDLQKEEERARREEDEEIERRRRAASQLAQQRGLDAKDDDLGDDFVEVQRGETAQTPKGEALTEIRQSIPAAAAEEHDGEDFTSITSLETKKVMIQDIGNGAAFIPARLPHFT